MTVCVFLDVDKARKLGLDEFVQANPSKFMHAELFRTLQKLTLDYRLNDIYTCLVRASSAFSPIIIPPCRMTPLVARTTKARECPYVILLPFRL